MTKKTIINGVLIVLLLALCVSFNACEKDGVFKPKQKISKIFADFKDYSYEWNEEIGEYEITEILYPKQLVQDWTWDKNKLGKIDFWGFYFRWDDEIPTPMIYSTDRYFYEKNKLVRIEQDQGFYSEISYKGSKIEKLESYDGGRKLWQIMDFTYEKNKISKILITIYPSDYAKNIEGKFLATFLPKEFVSKIVKKTEKNRSKKSIESITFTVNYTYTGDNVKEMIITYNEEGYQFQFNANYISYDTKHNPLYKKLGVDIDEEFMFGNSIVSSKNNPLEAKYVYTEIDEEDSYNSTAKYQFTYTYNKDFPTVTEIKIIDEDGDIYTEKVYYEYQ